MNSFVVLLHEVSKRSYLKVNLYPRQELRFGEGGFYFLFRLNRQFVCFSSSPTGPEKEVKSEGRLRFYYSARKSRGVRVIGLKCS